MDSSLHAASNTVTGTSADQWVATLLWAVTASLLGFLCFTHFAVEVCFVLGAPVPSWIAPAALP